MTARMTGATVIVIALLAALGVLGVSTAQAATTLCSGSSYSACTGMGYTDHGYSAHSGTSYWGAYAGHNCTNYVAYVETQNGVAAPSYSLGNANQWWSQAAGHVTESTTTPVVGSVAWWDAGTLMGPDGHVAYVEGVTGSPGSYTITISEDAYSSGPFDWKKITQGDTYWPGGFIYFANLGSGGGASIEQKEVAWFQGSTLWTFAGSNLGVSGSASYYAPTWGGVGDYDKNGHDDLFLYNASPDTMYWMSSNGTTLGANGLGTIRTGMGGAPDWAAVGDFDGDGYRNDLVWFKGNTLYTFEGTGLVTTGVVTGFHAPTWGGVGDYNHDGKDDLFLYDGPTDTLYWMSSNGSAVGASGLGTIRTSIGGAPDWAGVGNFTGDGYRDSIAYFRGATLFTFTGPNLAWTGTANFSAPTWGGVSDHDGDGKDDLLLYNGSTTSFYWLSSNGTAVGTNGLGFIRGPGIGAPNWAGVGRFAF